MTSASIPLSVLDLAPIGAGSTAADALRGSVRLARESEQLGYDRYWFAEHHDVASVASCSPSVLVAAVAAVTHRIRVGSGGVMLPNHQPLVVAEQFGTLQALYPERIDLGIGRAPAADQSVATALRCTDAAEFPRHLGELVRFFDTPRPIEGSDSPVSAVPAMGNRPELWLLGVGPRSAALAGMLGLSFAYAHHIAPENVRSTLAAYRAAFRPSGLSPTAHTMIAVGAVCAESDAQAQRLAAPAALLYVRLRTGDRNRPLPSIVEAVEHSYTDQERALVAKQAAGRFVGTPEAVRAGIDRVVAESGADEVMVTTQVAGYEDRRRSYALLAEAYALDRVTVAV